MAWRQKELEVYIGKGITLPLKLVGGKPPLETGFDLIRSSIRMILAWSFGTRFFLNEFGSRLEELLEEPNDVILEEMVEHITSDAINKWEKRVELLGVIAEGSKKDLGYKMSLTITYRIKAVDRTDTFVYPFYYQITT